MTMTEVAAKPPPAIVKPVVPSLRYRVAARAVAMFISTVGASMRLRWEDRSGTFDKPQVGPSIYCLWHNRLSMAMKAYHGHVRPRTTSRGLVAMVSASRDGGFLSAVLERFDVQPVRGSTSRRGAQALRELTTWARRGYDIAITPDGPRGPRFVAQPGVIALAQLTAFPIIPFSCRIGWKITTKSWDRFQIPLPFSHCDMVFGDPIVVPREATEADRESLRLHLQKALDEISGD
jgi:lysophospholipid acyltransferase (LPLAT)-like uncharacterized protein